MALWIVPCVRTSLGMFMGAAAQGFNAALPITLLSCTFHYTHGRKLIFVKLKKSCVTFEDERCLVSKKVEYIFSILLFPGWECVIL